jgi:hypothetical protein
MQLTAEEEMTDLICACLPELDEVEAAFVRDCWLREPKIGLSRFAKVWRLTAKDLNEIRTRTLERLRALLAEKGIKSIQEIL